jgi:uncharacterized protein YjbJ (UPF0337 family)
MNLGRIEGNWKQIKGRMRKRWGRLTHGGADRAQGQYEILAGHLQEAFAISREEAESRIEAWQNGVGAGLQRLAGSADRTLTRL